MESIQEVIAECVDGIKVRVVHCIALLKYRLLKGI
jgi:hypothetical protein